MWSLKKFKVGEVLHVTSFYIICSSNFPENCLCHSVLSLPKSIHLCTYYFITPSWNDSIVGKKLRCKIFVPRCWKMLAIKNEDNPSFANDHQTIERAKVAIEETQIAKKYFESFGYFNKSIIVNNCCAKSTTLQMQNHNMYFTAWYFMINPCSTLVKLLFK